MKRKRDSTVLDTPVAQLLSLVQQQHTQQQQQQQLTQQQPHFSLSNIFNNYLSNNNHNNNSFYDTNDPISPTTLTAKQRKLQAATFFCNDNRVYKNTKATTATTTTTTTTTIATTTTTTTATSFVNNNNQWYSHVNSGSVPLSTHAWTKDYSQYYYQLYINLSQAPTTNGEEGTTVEGAREMSARWVYHMDDSANDSPSTLGLGTTTAAANRRAFVIPQIQFQLEASFDDVISADKNNDDKDDDIDNEEQKNNSDGDDEQPTISQPLIVTSPTDILTLDVNVYEQGECTNQIFTCSCTNILSYVQDNNNPQTIEFHNSMSLKVRSERDENGNRRVRILGVTIRKTQEEMSILMKPSSVFLKEMEDELVRISSDDDDRNTLVLFSIGSSTNAPTPAVPKHTTATATATTTTTKTTMTKEDIYNQMLANPDFFSASQCSQTQQYPNFLKILAREFPMSRVKIFLVDPQLDRLVPPATVLLHQRDWEEVEPTSSLQFNKRYRNVKEPNVELISVCAELPSANDNGDGQQPTFWRVLETYIRSIAARGGLLFFNDFAGGFLPDLQPFYSKINSSLDHPCVRYISWVRRTVNETQPPLQEIDERQKHYFIPSSTSTSASTAALSVSTPTTTTVPPCSQSFEDLVKDDAADTEFSLDRLIYIVKETDTGRNQRMLSIEKMAELKFELQRAC